MASAIDLHAIIEELMETAFSMWSMRRLCTEGHAENKLCKTQAEVILKYLYPNVCGTGQGEAMYRKYKILQIGDGQAYGLSGD
jgi:hypothetical protein